MNLSCMALGIYDLFGYGIPGLVFCLLSRSAWGLSFLSFAGASGSLWRV